MNFHEPTLNFFTESKSLNEYNPSLFYKLSETKPSRKLLDNEIAKFDFKRGCLFEKRLGIDEKGKFYITKQEQQTIQVDTTYTLRNCASKK